MYLKSVENVITLGKLIGLLFLFCLPLLSILFLKTKRNDLARPVMGTIFLVLVHREKLKPKGPIAEKLVSSDISHIALASVLLGENMSEEVDDYDNNYYYK